MLFAACVVFAIPDGEPLLSEAQAAPPRGACCFSDGSCQILRQRECDRAGGTYLGNGTNCGQCQRPTGACCLSGGNCATTTAAQCASLGGVYVGDGTDCISVICPATGACCLPVLPPACDVRTAASCFAIGGTYLGDNVPCTADICGDAGPIGACCITELGGTFCSDIEEFNCLILGGQFFPGATCAEVICPEFPPPGPEPE
jgi:hypothetical protein